MPQNKNIEIPIKFIVLDIIGTLLLAVGIIELVSNLNLIPASFQFNNYAIALIVVGVLLMLPLILHIKNIILGNQAREI